MTVKAKVEVCYHSYYVRFGEKTRCELEKRHNGPCGPKVRARAAAPAMVPGATTLIAPEVRPPPPPAPPKRMTVADSIVADLREAGYAGVCGSHWYATYRPTYAQRISIDLRKRGFRIASWPCTEHEHKGTIHRYRLVIDPERTAPKGEPG